MIDLISRPCTVSAFVDQDLDCPQQLLAQVVDRTSERSTHDYDDTFIDDSIRDLAILLHGKRKQQGVLGGTVSRAEQNW